MKIEGVNYDINWSGFKVGYSFFIPCLDPKATFGALKPTLRRRKYSVIAKVSIVDGIRGIRVWRLKDTTPATQRIFLQ